MAYWLMKSEPDVFSLEDLQQRPGQREPWDGVRNYQARNFMRDQMRCGDEVLFYHSNCSPPGIAGLAKVVREAYPDPSSWDPKSQYFDPKSSPEKPRWVMVDVAFVKAFPRILGLAEIKADPQLQTMLVAQKGQRLSVQPVEAKHFKRVCQLAAKPPAKP